MSSPYAPVSITGYNSSPPSDDGSEIERNAIKWSNHTDKIGDPLKAAIEQINTNVADAFTNIYGQIQSEANALVTPTNYNFPPGHVRRYGAVGGGVTDDSAAVESAINVASSGLGYVFGEPGDTYYLGTLAGDATKFQITSDIRIDFSQSDITITGTDGAFTDCKCFQFFDCAADISIRSFEDRTFNISTSTSRGVQPINIRNSLLNTKGHRIGPLHVEAGQSILTASSANPATARASNIQLVGPVTGNESYYGVNLSNNGDQVHGSYFVNAYNRLVFLYGVSDVCMDIHGGDSPNATSSALYVWRTTRDTKDIYIRAVFDELNGLVRIANDDGDTGAILDNINLDITVNSYGANLPVTSSQIVAIGTTSGAGWAATSDVTIDHLNVRLHSDTLPDTPFSVLTNSSNYGDLETPGIIPSYSNIVGFRHRFDNTVRVGITSASLEGAITGATQANPVVITETAHDRANGEDVVITGITGMTEINDRVFTVANVTTNTYELQGEDGTGHTAYTSGGTAHHPVAIDIDALTYDTASALWALAVDSIARFDTSFSGQRTAIERWSVHGYTASGGDAVITAQNRAHLSQSGGDTPLGAFVMADTGSVMYAYMTGYVSTTGRFTVNYRMLG